MARETQKYHFQFTHNNYEEDHYNVLKVWFSDNCKYACMQKEVGEEGTPHIQGYFSLKKKMRTLSLQKTFNQLLGTNLHLEWAKGSAQQNRVYCSKSGGTDFWECGEMKQGKRNDLEEVSDKILRKRPLNEIAVEHPVSYIRYNKGFIALAAVIEQPPEHRTMDVTLYFGDSNTGKTKMAEHYAFLFGEYHLVQRPDKNRPLYWDNYRGQKTIIIDEFKGWITPTTLNRYLDSYKCELDCRGVTKWAYFEHVIITSNYEPDQWWSSDVVWHRESLFRRLNNIFEFRGTSHVDCVIKNLK